MSANDVIFRPASKSDAHVIAELFRISSEGVADYVWTQMAAESGSNADLVDIGAERYRREGVDFSYQNCDIAEIEGEPVGMLHAYRMGADAGKVEDGFDPVLRPYAELEEPSSLYISGLALFPKYRGEGVGTRLLDFAYKRARVEGLKKISLICFEENEGAYRLYQREGFNERTRRAVVPHPLIQHGGDAVLMVKED
jgi:ribosomal protein S18 acetylase RimI-like enzyme